MRSVTKQVLIKGFLGGLRRKRRIEVGSKFSIKQDKKNVVDQQKENRWTFAASRAVFPAHQSSQHHNDTFPHFSMISICNFMSLSK